MLVIYINFNWLNNIIVEVGIVLARIAIASQAVIRGKIEVKYDDLV